MTSENLVFEENKEEEEIDTQDLLRRIFRSFIRESKNFSEEKIWDLSAKVRAMEKGDWDEETRSLAETLLFRLHCEYEEKYKNKKRRFGPVRAVFKKLFRRRSNKKKKT